MKFLYLRGFYLLNKETKRDRIAEAKFEVNILFLNSVYLDISKS